MFKDKLEEAEHELNRMAQSVIDGESNALKAYLRLKEHVSYVQDTIKSFQDIAIDELYKHPQQNAIVDGMRLSLVSRKNYTYNHCESWESANNKRKEIEQLMKSISEPIVFSETGEWVEPAAIRESQYIKTEVAK